MTRLPGYFGPLDKAEIGWGEAAPPSPCIRQCTLDENDECVGCGRLMNEILAWSEAPASRKIDIVKAAESRREARRLRRLQAHGYDR